MEKYLLQLPDLKPFNQANHGFSTVEAGNMSFRYGKAGSVRENRAAFLLTLGVQPEKVVSAELEHKNTIIRVTKSDTNSGVLDNDYKLKADALITNEPNIYLYHVVADCASILYFDLIHHAIGLAHCGWRSTHLQLPGKVVTRMTQEFGTDKKDLIIGIGPSILPCCYAYGKPDQAQYPTWLPYLTIRENGLTYIDNNSYILDQLETAGVPTEHIYQSGQCTAHDTRFFSHYRDKQQNQPDQGRFAAIIGLTSA